MPPGATDAGVKGETVRIVLPRVRALAYLDPATIARVSQRGEVYLPSGQLNVANCRAPPLFVACPISLYQPAALDDDLPEQSRQDRHIAPRHVGKQPVVYRSERGRHVLD
jgi:hypothetical protein